MTMETPLPDDTPALYVTYRTRCRNETYTLVIGNSRIHARLQREPWVTINERAYARTHARTHGTQSGGRKVGDRR